MSSAIFSKASDNIIQQYEKYMRVGYWYCKWDKGNDGGTYTVWESSESVLERE